MKERIQRFWMYICLAFHVLTQSVDHHDKDANLCDGVVEYELLAMAKKRVNRSKRLKKHSEYLFGSRWTVWADHLEWVAFGDEAEIAQWCEGVSV